MVRTWAQADLLLALTPLNLKRWPMKTMLSKKFDSPRYQIFSASFRGAVFGPPHSKKACVELYISNKHALTDNMYHVGAHVQRMLRVYTEKSRRPGWCSYGRTYNLVNLHGKSKRQDSPFFRKVLFVFGINKIMHSSSFLEDWRRAGWFIPPGDREAASQWITRP